MEKISVPFFQKTKSFGKMELWSCLKNGITLLEGSCPAMSHFPSCKVKQFPCLSFFSCSLEHLLCNVSFMVFCSLLVCVPRGQSSYLFSHFCVARSKNNKHWWCVKDLSEWVDECWLTLAVLPLPPVLSSLCSNHPLPQAASCRSGPQLRALASRDIRNSNLGR